MRNAQCPICRQNTDVELRLRFGSRFQLPTEVELRHCSHDNFMFLSGGSQSQYDEYYANVVNDSCHQEVAAGEVRSPISKLQMNYLADTLEGFFDTPRRVLDFGCGGASLLIELAIRFPSSSFFGFDPGPAAQSARDKARMLGLTNLSIAGFEESAKGAPYDLVISSHVVEHLLNLELRDLFRGLVADNGLLYLEVPDALRYEFHERLEFLYYFDRLHVNHFSPQSLTRLAGTCGFGYRKHFSYAFPYRDGGTYPALGMLFQKDAPAVDVESANLLRVAQGYIGREKKRARSVAGLLENYDGVLVWGAGDNFYRSIGNEGPLSRLQNMVVLDRRPHEVKIANQTFQAIEPLSGIRAHDWPVAVTVSEGRSDIARQVAGVDPDRRVLFV